MYMLSFKLMKLPLLYAGDPRACQQNLNIDNGVVTYSATPSIPGTTATYACNGDYELHGGDESLVCRFSRVEGRSVWIGEPPICEQYCGCIA